MSRRQPAVNCVEESLHCLSSVEEPKGVVPIVARAQRGRGPDDDAIERLDRTRPLRCGRVVVPGVVLAVGALGPLGRRLNRHQLRELFLCPVPVGEAEQVPPVAQILSPYITLIHRDAAVMLEPLNQQPMKEPRERFVVVAMHEHDIGRHRLG